MDQPKDKWKKCKITNRLYRLGTVNLNKARNSRFNPRVEKKVHVNELKKSIQEEGQLTPLTCVEIEETTDGINIEILDGKHRFAAARILKLLDLDAKIYSKDLTPLEQKKIAIYLNKGVKKINAGEFFRAADELYHLTEKELRDKGAKYINEARIIDKAGLKSAKDIFEITIGRIVHKLQNSKEPISDYISDAQTPKKMIEMNESTAVLTAQNVGSFLRLLCRETPVGVWEPYLTNLSKEEYEKKLMERVIKDEKNLRDIEFNNILNLMNMISLELLKPWLRHGDYNKATNFCKHHVFRGISIIIKKIIQDSGSKVESTPLYTEDKIDLENVKKYILKFKEIDWSNQIFKERVPKLISDYLMRYVF